MKGYKVVCRRQFYGGREEIVSACVTQDWAVIAYRVGEAVKPRPGCGPLCVFDDLSKARRMSKAMPDYQNVEIYECEFTPSASETVWYYEYPLPEEMTFDLPPGTVLADEVTLTALVEVRE